MYPMGHRPMRWTPGVGSRGAGGPGATDRMTMGQAGAMAFDGIDPDLVSDKFREFWTERHLCLLVTPRADGTPHVVPVGVTLDVEAGLARVICRIGSQKARNVATGGETGVRAVVSQVDGPRWSTLEGVA